MAQDVGHSPRWRILNHQSLPAPYVRRQTWWQCDLHGIGAFTCGIDAQSTLCDREAWFDGFIQSGRQRRRCPWCTLQRHLPRFVRTPLVDKQIPEQAAKFGISEADVIKNIMLKDTVDGEFTTVQDVAEVALMFAAFPTNALTGQSLIVSHGWTMQ
jgi:hypothetical protein